MMQRTRRTKAMISAMLSSIALAACSPDTEEVLLDSYIDLEFEHLERELCAGSVAHLDRFIERVFEFLEAPLPVGFQVPVRVVDDPPCGPRTACYSRGGVVYMRELDRTGYRTSAVLRHEVTHAVIAQAWGRTVPFLSEGLAETMSRSPSWSDASGELLPVGEMLDAGGLEIDYSAAARFVRFLIDTRGLAAFKKLYQGATTRSQEAIRALILDVYGESFDGLETEYLSGAPRCQYQFDVCDPLAAEPVELGWSLTLAASCLDPDFYGSEGEGSPMFGTQRTIDLGVGGLYRLRASSELVISPEDQLLLFSQVVFSRCGGCDEQFVRVYRGADVELELEAGLYTFELLPAGDSVMTLDLEYLGDVPEPP